MHSDGISGADYARYFSEWYYRLTRLQESEYSTRVVGHRNTDDEGVNAQCRNETHLSRQSRSSPPQRKDTKCDVNDQEQYLRRQPRRYERILMKETDQSDGGAE
jgi:hypothetical protein